MKARWFIITVLLAFPIAFGFFLSEARFGDTRPARPVLVIPPQSSIPAATVSHSTPSIESHVPHAEPQSSKEEPLPESTSVSSGKQPVEVVIGGFVVSPKPVLVAGTFAKEDNSLVYDADAKLRLASDIVLSSPTGVMVSNEKQTIFAGDMQIEAGKNTITAHEGVLDTTTNQMKATVASISFTNEKNQLIRMTGENVTLELPSGEKSPTTNTILADSVTVESPAATSTTPKP